MKIIFSFITGLILCFQANAENLVAIAREGKVYDEANAKYVTLNQVNEEVVVIPGMVFPASQHITGWYMIEYSPGLHAFIPDQITTSTIKQVGPGTYSIKNNPGQEINIQVSEEELTATVNGVSYKGHEIDGIMIFADANNNIVFSLVDIGEGPIAITYENSVTKFF